MPRRKKITTSQESPRKRQLQPLTDAQSDYIEEIRYNDIVFCLGPAGAGKTHVAAGIAVEMLLNKEVERIILTRPAVATEDLGFLPGELEKKIEPYLLPLYDELGYYINVDININQKKIILAPIAFMRGRTFKNSFIILDEAQNCTYSQIKMVLTRIGEGSKIVVTGDLTQSDLRNSGLEKCVSQMYNLTENGVGIIKFTDRDTSIRHPIIEKLLLVMDKEC